MSFDYAAVRDGFAVALIKQFGREITLQRRTEGTYDPTKSSAPVAVSSATVLAVVLDFKDSQIDGETIRRGDRRIIVSASGLTMTPKPGDRLLIDGAPIEVVDVGQFNPAGVATHYVVQGRAA